MAAGAHELAGNRVNLLARHIEDVDGDVSGFGNREADRGGRVERVG